MAAALTLGLAAWCVGPRRVTAQERGAVALGELVAGLGTTARVLMIAAHPDDEDTRLLTWLAKGQHVETAYLSLTRGDGGQNLIGNELGEALGVIRTEELLAARRIDGAHQYFTRAYDFGFSKTAAETFTHWPHDSLLGDVVTIVRAFRPHIIIAVFSGTPRDGHGHHQVSGILAREAYDVSGDTVRFPVAQYGPAWTVSKFYRDRSYFGPDDATLSISVGAYDPLLGESYAEIAARSRSQHKSQGFGQLIPKGPFTAYVRRDATRVNAATAADHERSMFDGIDTTFVRLTPVSAAVARVRASYDPFAPQAVLEPLAALAKAEETVEQDARDPDLLRTMEIARARTAHAIMVAAGLALEATTSHDIVAVQPHRAAVRVALYNRGRVPLTVEGLHTHTVAGGRDDALAPSRIAPDSVFRDSVQLEDSVVTQPWWLAQPRHGDLFGTPVSRIPEDERRTSRVRLEVTLAAGQTLARVSPSSTPVQRVADPARGEVDRPLAFVPPVSLSLDDTIEYAPANAHVDRTVRVLVRSGVDSTRDVTVGLQLPRGLTADSGSRHVTVPAYGARRVDFRVMGALPAGEATARATAEADGQVVHMGYIPIEYDHIRPQKLYRPAAMRLEAVDVRIPKDLTVAYLPGVGDNVAPTLAQLGIPVTVIDSTALATTDFSRFRAVVVGPRAYESNPDLRANNGRLLDYVRAGGTLVVQYGQYEMTEPGMMPYPIALNRPHDRVTDENAPVRVLDAQSPLLTAPNRITDADFAGWVQERSLYMPRTFDPRYHAILSINDPGEPPNDAAILVAPLGKGTYIYTTFAFFRQLPAGNPGAARLFVNLLAAGHR